ncbi:hypothetical protein SAMN04488128_106340 [Chitinophaga eiseniae]|uniref:DUF302 domain-containing protein n=1 Tax=Chitinophaga eiseniae TaxID=634771 RepID=A0A1T4TVA8_9BACT|nr:DUF302 domain-containing protein [Chitinophaga eiseniae]SKA44159.1 hypothetical protein SAMN04488128_106340 [Chitinophaga eiseniae]
MKNAYHTLLLDHPFETVTAAAKTAITDNGWLLLHEINPRQILAGHGYHVPNARQLFFFHPSYLYALWQQDAAAVTEAPLKLLIQEMSPQQTCIRYINIDHHFQGYTENISPIVSSIREQQARVLAQVQATFSS